MPLVLSSLPSLTTAEVGRWLYQRIFSGPILTRYQANVFDRLLLYLPSDLFDWPWQMLHDGFQPLARRHAIVLLPIERLKAPVPSLRLEDGPLHILLTLALDEEHAALGAIVEQMLDGCKQRYPNLVFVRKESGTLDARCLLQIFQGALEPFHLWQHVGPCSADFSLKLADAAQGAQSLNYLLSLQPGLRCFVLSTRQAVPAASALSQLNVPFLLCQSALSSSPSDLSLLQGFYDRLLTYDLAIAGTLAQLDKYLKSEASKWSSLTMLAQTPKLHLGLPQSVRTGHGRRLQIPEAPVKLLFLKANPRHKLQTQERLRIDQEMRGITLAMGENRRFFDRREEGAVRVQDLSRYLLSHRPELLHFSGHGFESGKLAFEKNAGSDGSKGQTPYADAGLVAEPDPIPFESIARVLAEYKETLRCVVLNACHTELLAEAICEHIDCAIGMRGAVDDSVAIRFSYGLYQALAYGDSVGQAFRKACNKINMRYHTNQTQVFQIKSKPGVNPDDIFFVQIQGGRL